MARPSLARSFSEMIEEGAISREGKIVDMNKLKKLRAFEKSIYECTCSRNNFLSIYVTRVDDFFHSTWL